VTWKLSIVRCLIYGGVVSWGVFKAGTNGFDGLNDMTPLQKIDLAGDMAAAFGGVLLAFLDTSIQKLSTQQQLDSTTKQPNDMKTTIATVGAAVLILFAAGTAMLTSITGCSTTGQRTAANTLQSLEATATTTYSGYCDGVLKGLIPTNDFPIASKAYNQFQADYALAVTLAQNNSNALAPDNLNAELSQFVNIVTTASKLTNTKIIPTP
jgi:hypothetical protein